MDKVVNVLMKYRFCRKLPGLCKGTADGDATEGRCLVVAGNDETYVESYLSEKSVSESTPFSGVQQKHLQSQQDGPHYLQKLLCFLVGPVFSDILMQTK